VPQRSPGLRGPATRAIYTQDLALAFQGWRLLDVLSVVAMSVVFAWLVKRTAGSVVAALALHTAINFWPSFVPVLPTAASYRAYAFVVAMLVLLALWASGPTAVRRAVGSLPGFAEKKP
jgi:membrane protease YdiL (CAAX protease family)